MRSDTQKPNADAITIAPYIMSVRANHAQEDLKMHISRQYLHIVNNYNQTIQKY